MSYGFDTELNVVATLRDREIQGAIELRQREQDVARALRSALELGKNIEELSEASGLTIAEIRRRTERFDALTH